MQVLSVDCPYLYHAGLDKRPRLQAAVRAVRTPSLPHVPSLGALAASVVRDTWEQGPDAHAHLWADVEANLPPGAAQILRHRRVVKLEPKSVSHFLSRLTAEQMGIRAGGAIDNDRKLSWDDFEKLEFLDVLYQAWSFALRQDGPRPPHTEQARPSSLDILCTRTESAMTQLCAHIMAETPDDAHVPILHFPWGQSFIQSDFLFVSPRVKFALVQLSGFARDAQVPNMLCQTRAYLRVLSSPQRTPAEKKRLFPSGRHNISARAERMLTQLERSPRPLCFAADIDGGTCDSSCGAWTDAYAVALVWRCIDIYRGGGETTSSDQENMRYGFIHYLADSIQPQDQLFPCTTISMLTRLLLVLQGYYPQVFFDVLCEDRKIEHSAIEHDRLFRSSMDAAPLRQGGAQVFRADEEAGSAPFEVYESDLRALIAEY